MFSNPYTKIIGGLAQHSYACRSFTCSSTSLQSFVLDETFLKQCHQKTNEKFSVTNPYSGKVLGTVPNCGRDDALHAVHNASQAFTKWKNVSAKVFCIIVID